MMRTGFVRDSAAAIHCGAFKNRPPTSHAPGLYHLLNALVAAPFTRARHSLYRFLRNANDSAKWLKVATTGKRLANAKALNNDFARTIGKTLTLIMVSLEYVPGLGKTFNSNMLYPRHAFPSQCVTCSNSNMIAFALLQER
jgi:hypothetical protein